MAQSESPVCVKEVMTSKVRVAEPDEPLDSIRQILTEERCHHIPVVDDGLPVGMISSRDLVHAARRHGPEQLAVEFESGGTARDIMKTRLETIGPDAPIDEAIERIGAGRIHALIVVDGAGRLVGIVTHRDLLGHLLG